MNLPGDDIRVHEDTRTDDAAHHDHRRIKQAQTPRELCGRGFGCLPLALLCIFDTQWPLILAQE
jgi:hypothetical protein